jgi:hypothetical protein
MRLDRSEIAADIDAPVPDDSSGDSLTVQYLGRLRIAVSGRFTGTLYRFSPLQPVLRVDARDAFHLLDSGLFGIAQ